MGLSGIILKVDPSRFLPNKNESETKEDLAKKTFTFGFGPRKCPGKMLGKLVFKLALAALVKRYIFRPPTSVTQPKFRILMKSASVLPPELSYVQMRKREVQLAI